MEYKEIDGRKYLVVRSGAGRWWTLAKTPEEDADAEQAFLSMPIPERSVNHAQQIS